MIVYVVKHSTQGSSLRAHHLLMTPMSTMRSTAQTFSLPKSYSAVLLLAGYAPPLACLLPGSGLLLPKDAASLQARCTAGLGSK